MTAKKPSRPTLVLDSAGDDYTTSLVQTLAAGFVGVAREFDKLLPDGVVIAALHAAFVEAAGAVASPAEIAKTLRRSARLLTISAEAAQPTPRPRRRPRG